MRSILTTIVLAAFALKAVDSPPPPGMISIPGGSYKPLYAKKAKPRGVEPFFIDAAQVTNAQFLDFVTKNPAWRRSQIKTTLADIEQRSKALQALADDEAAIMRSRQRVIDLYQEQGYLRFREAADLRVNAQQDYLERSRTFFDQEEALLRTALETVAQTADQRRQIEERLATLAAKRQRMEREAAQVTLERAIRSPFEALRDIQERASRAESEFKTREEQVRLLRESGAISELESLRRLATAREESARQLELLASEARAVAEAAPGNERFAEAMRQIAEAARTAAAGAKELGQRAKEVAEPFTAGFQKGLKSFIEDAEAMGKQIESITSRAFNGMTDALTQFVMTGKLDFKSLANSIISDLIRIQIQRAITIPLANAMMGLFGFANGGVMTGCGPMALRSYAAGGIANSPQLALFGEGSRPEAYVPLPDGRSIPVTMSGGASAGDVFNISVSVSDAGASSRGDDPGGRDLGRAIASAVRQELLAQKRAGGLLDGRRAV